MAALEYVGRYPDSDGTLVHKTYADTQSAAIQVTNAFIDNTCTAAAANLVSTTWVDQRVALYSTQTQAATALSSVSVPLTQLGVPNGVAQSGATNSVPAEQLPLTLNTDRIAQCYDLSSGTTYLTSTQQVTTTNFREYLIASIPIPDPGYPWIPMPFATVRGQAVGPAAPTRYTGIGNYGLLTVAPPSGVSNTVYGVGVCSGDTYYNSYQVFPYSSTNGLTSPTTVGPVNGGLTLNLTGACWSGTGYRFSAVGLSYFVLVVPAI
jgi:hypothetical protein